MSTSRRTRSLRRARASESLRASASRAPTLTTHVSTPSGYASTSLGNASTPIENASTPLRIASDHPTTLPVPTCSSGRDVSAPRRRSRHATSRRRSCHAAQAGDTPASGASGPSASQSSGHNRSLSQTSGTSSDQYLSADGLSSHTNGLCIYADSDHAADGSIHADYVSTRANHGSSLENDPSFSVDLLEDTSTYHLPRRRVGLERHFRALGFRVVKDALLALLRHTVTLVKKRSLIDVNSLVNLDPNVVQGADSGGESGLGGDERSSLVASTPSLSSELRDWVAWYRAGLLGSSSDLGERADGLDGHSGAQDDHAGVLGESMGVLDDGTGVLDDHIGALDDPAGDLDDRTGPLDERTAAVDDFTGALDDDDSALDEYTDALEDHTGDLVNDAITKILRFNDEAIRKARVSLRIYSTFNRAGERPSSGAGEDPKSSAGQRPLSWVGESTSGSAASGPAKETGSLPDPSWGVWRREAWYVAEDEGPSNGRRDTSTWAEDPSSSTKRKLGPSTPEYEPGASTLTRELGISMPKNEIRPTPSPAGTPASHAPPSPVFDSPETFSTGRTTPSPTKVALPHASPTARRPSPTIRRPSPRRPLSLVPPPFSSRPHRSVPQGNATSHQGSDGQSATAKESICRRWSSAPYFGSSLPYSGPSPLHSGPALLHSGSPPLHSGPSPPHPGSPPPHSRPPPLHSGPPPSISVRHSSLSRANIRNVLDALPALSRGRSAPPRATISNATAPNATTSNATTSNATIPNATTTERSPPSRAEASVHPSAHAATPSHPVPSSSCLTSTSKPADAEQPQARDFEILLSPSSSLRALPSLALGDVLPSLALGGVLPSLAPGDVPLAEPPTFRLSQVPLGVQTTLRDAEHLTQAARAEHLARGAKEGISEPDDALDDALRRPATLDDDALRRDALDDIARAIHRTRRMLHRNRTTEIKLDKDPKRVDARCYTEGLEGMMGTCAAFSDRLAHDPSSARTCSSDWFCEMRDKIVAQEASIRSAIHALVNHEISEKLTALEDLAQPAN